MGNIEQVKKILTKNISVSVSVLDYSKGEIKPAKDTFCGTIVSSDVDKLSKEIVSALYSEPQVCPKPEQMMICPKCSTDGKQVSDEDFGKTTKLYSIPACIPVPSTPASVPLPPELLTERDLQEFIEGTLVLAYMEGQANSNASATKLAKEIIAKCHQSEAARIKQLELGKKLSMESDNRVL